MSARPYHEAVNTQHRGVGFAGERVSMSAGSTTTTRAPRSDARTLIGTGALVGSGCALVLPVLWVALWGLFGAVDVTTTITWVVISLIYAVPAAIVFALVGAVAGMVTSWLWRQRDRWGRWRSQAAAIVVTGAIVGICAGLALALLLNSVFTGVTVGLIAAAVASAAAGLSLRRLERRAAQPA